MDLLRPVLSNDGPPQAPRPFRTANRGFYLASVGLKTRGLRALERASEQLSKDPAAASWRARCQALSARVGRLYALWDVADAGFKACLGPLLQHKPLDEGSVALALWVEGLCVRGLLHQAAEIIESTAGQFREASVDLARSMLALARGDMADALELARLAGQSPHPESAAWARLTAAEALMELERLDEAAALCDAVSSELESRGRFAEEYLKALWVQASCAVVGWRLKPGDTAPVTAALAKVRRYASPFVRYRAAVDFLLALQREGAPGRAQAEGLSRATSSLEHCGARLDAARAQALYARLVRDAADLATTAASERSRQTFDEVGATARARQAVAPAAGEMSGASLGQSVLARTLAGLAGSDEDVELEAIFAVNRELSSSLDPERVLQTVLREAARVLRAERGAVFRADRSDGTDVRCVAAIGLPRDQVREEVGILSFGALRRARESGEVVLTDNALVDDHLRANASVLASEIRSLLCAPIRRGTSVLGYLYLDSRAKERVFKEAHRELLAVLTTQAAVALENALAYDEVARINRTLETMVEERTRDLTQTSEELAHKLEELRSTQLRLLEAENQALHAEMAIARSIQQSIVPPPSALRLGGLTLVGGVEPASQVGGDFWTYVQLGPSRTLVIVGDVSGHGVGAGMLTASAKACIETLALQSNADDLSRLLRTLSDVIAVSGKGRLIMTAFACVVDTAAHTLLFASAGHLAPLLLEAAGGLPRLVPLLSRGTPLGSARWSLSPATRAISRGDRLVLFTDGLLECTNADGVAHGIGRLRKSVLANTAKAGVDYFRALVEGYSGFLGSAARADDITLVTLEVME